jgi:transposase
MIQKQRYPSDLSDEEWGYLEPWLCPSQDGQRGRRRTVDRRAVSNAIG